MNHFSGEYTCEASDYGISQNKSDLVDVITTPMVDIDPMSDYVPFRGSIRIRCLSFDPDAPQYHWYVNGFLIKRGRSDMIPETLQPAGSQLYVRSLQTRSVFTCKVANAAGAQNVTADIYVQPGKLIHQKKKNTSLSILYFTFSFSCTCALFWSIYDFFSQPIEQMIHVANSGTKTSSGRKWLEDITGRSDVRRRQKVRNHCFSLILWIDYRRQLVFRCFIFDHTLYRFSKLYPHWHR